MGLCNTQPPETLLRNTYVFFPPATRLEPIRFNARLYKRERVKPRDTSTAPARPTGQYLPRDSRSRKNTKSYVDTRTAVEGLKEWGKNAPPKINISVALAEISLPSRSSERTEVLRGATTRAATHRAKQTRPTTPPPTCPGWLAIPPLLGDWGPTVHEAGINTGTAPAETSLLIRTSERTEVPRRCDNEDREQPRKESATTPGRLALQPLRQRDQEVRGSRPAAE